MNICEFYYNGNEISGVMWIYYNNNKIGINCDSILDLKKVFSETSFSRRLW